MEFSQRYWNKKIILSEVFKSWMLFWSPSRDRIRGYRKRKPRKLPCWIPKKRIHSFFDPNLSSTNNRRRVLRCVFIFLSKRNSLSLSLSFFPLPLSYFHTISDSSPPFCKLSIVCPLERISTFVSLQRDLRAAGFDPRTTHGALLQLCDELYREEIEKQHILEELATFEGLSTVRIPYNDVKPFPLWGY